MEGVPFMYIQLKCFIFEKLYIHLAGSSPSTYIYRFGKIEGLCHKSEITTTKIFRGRAIPKVCFCKYFSLWNSGIREKLNSLGVPLYAEVVAAFWLE